jgi:hypothetical protein
MTVIILKFIIPVNGLFSRLPQKPSCATVLHNRNSENVNDIQNFDLRNYQKRAIWKTRKKHSYSNMKTDHKYFVQKRVPFFFFAKIKKNQNSAG